MVNQESYWDQIQIKFLEKQFIDKTTGKQLDWKVTYNDEKEN